MRIQVRRRHPVSPKEVKRANDAIDAAFGVRPVPEDTVIEVADADTYEFLLHKAHVVAVTRDPHGSPPFPALRALLARPPARRFVTVDMGAVPFVAKGADVMAPGITAADPAVQPGDLVWIKDEKHGRPLGIGSALVSGPEMQASTKGKAVRTLHFVGDEIWKIGDT